MTDEELSEHAKNLAYEIWMLVKLAGYLPIRSINPQDEVEVMINNGLIEAFAVHARNVADFLAKQPRKAMHASHFFTNTKEWGKFWRDNEEWKDVDDQIEDICDRVDKEVVHLGKGRIHAVGSKKDWNPNSVISLIAPRLRTFAEKADKLPGEVKTLITEAISRGLIPAPGPGVVSTSMPITGFVKKL
jgi:hypothetical protein